MKKNLLLFLFLSLSLSLSAQVPDYKVSIHIGPSAITGVSLMRAIVTIEELNNVSSSGPITVIMPKKARFPFTWVDTATIAGLLPVNNSQWTIDDSNPRYTKWTYNLPTFPAGGTSVFGYVGTYDPGNTDGRDNFTVQIISGSGGDITPPNNRAVFDDVMPHLISFKFFRQP